jgi:hypothetical protein
MAGSEALQHAQMSYNCCMLQHAMHTKRMFNDSNALFVATALLLTAQPNKKIESEGQSALPAFEIESLERIDALLDLKESQAAKAAAAAPKAAVSKVLPSTVQWGRQFKK